MSIWTRTVFAHGATDYLTELAQDPTDLDDEMRLISRTWFGDPPAATPSWQPLDASIIARIADALAAHVGEGVNIRVDDEGVLVFSAAEEDVEGGTVYTLTVAGIDWQGLSPQQWMERHGEGLVGSGRVNLRRLFADLVRAPGGADEGDIF